MPPHRILIVEDDTAIAKGLALNLKLANYHTAVAHDGESAIARIGEEIPHLVLLDINLPKKNGLEVLSDLRRMGDETPIIILSAREGEYDKVAALRLGADDYITKPFSLAELLARVDAVLRRVSAQPKIAPPSNNYAVGNVSLDMETRTAKRDDEQIKLTHLEFELLRFFITNPSRVFARDELLRKVWGQHSGSPRTVDNFVAQLRSKLEDDPENPCHFITVRGSGYRFDP